MKELPCILWNASKTKKTEDIELLKQISIAQKIPEKNLADYSQILAHSYKIFGGEGYSQEEISACNINPKKNYCSMNRKKDSFCASLCQICEQSSSYLGMREKHEKTVLYYLIDNNENVILYQGIEKNMFVSKKIIKATDKYGRWPIIKFHQEIYNFIFISFFSGSGIHRENFLERIMLHIRAQLPVFSRDYGQKEEELEEAFYMQAKVFISGHRKISEMEYEEALEIIRGPYQLDKWENKNGSKKKKLIPPDTEKNEKKKYGSSNHTMEFFQAMIPLAEYPERLETENQKKEQPVPYKGKDAKETEELAWENKKNSGEWFEGYPLPLNTTEISTISPEQMASLAISLARAGRAAIEPGIVDGQAGLLFCPMHSDKVFFTKDKMEMENCLSQMAERTEFFCFDVKKLSPFLRKQGILKQKQVGSVSALYRSSSVSGKSDRFSEMAREVLGETPQTALAALMAECRLYETLSERLSVAEKKSDYRKNLAFDHALSYSYAWDGNGIVKLSEFPIQKYAFFKKIKVEVKGYGNWEELIHEAMGRLWSCGAFDTFQMHLSSWGDGWAEFSYLLHNSTELVDLFCHIFHAVLPKGKENAYSMEITKKDGT